MSTEAVNLTQDSYRQSTVVSGEKGAQRKFTQAKKAEEGLRDFQGLMVNLMLSTMRSTVQKNDLFNGGQGEEIFQEMLDQEYSKKLSSSDILNFDTMLRRSLRLPMNETFQWQQVETLPEESLQRIHSKLSAMDHPINKGEPVLEPLSASVSKQLDGVAKSRNLLEQLPADLLENIDGEFLEDWKNRRDQYLEEKGYKAYAGNGLRQLNKELLLAVFKELDFAQTGLSSVNHQRGRFAYQQAGLQ